MENYILLIRMRNTLVKQLEKAKKKKIQNIKIERLNRINEKIDNMKKELKITPSSNYYITTYGMTSKELDIMRNKFLKSNTLQDWGNELRYTAMAFNESCY